MAEIIKIALLGIAGVLFAIQFRQQRPEYALLIGFALSILVFSFVCRMAGNLLEEFRGLQQYLGDSKGYLGILMKVVGITYLCEFSAGICKDAGFSSVSDQLEILGKLSVLFAGLPILLSVIRQIYSMSAETDGYDVAGIWDRGIGKGNAEAVPDVSNLCDRSDDADPAGRYSGGGGVSVERSHTGNEQFRHRYQKYIDLVDSTGDSVGIADSFCGSI